MAAEKTYNDLDVSLRKANEHRNAWFEGVQKCRLDDSLYIVLDRIVHAEVHRLVVVDENDKVIGIISLSDILLYLVLRPSGEGVGGSEQSLRATDPILKSSKSVDAEIGMDSARQRSQSECNERVPSRQASTVSDTNSNDNINTDDTTKTEDDVFKTELIDKIKDDSLPETNGHKLALSTDKNDSMDNLNGDNDSEKENIINGSDGKENNITASNEHEIKVDS